MDGPKRYVSSAGVVGAIALDGPHPVVLLENEEGITVARIEGDRLVASAPLRGKASDVMVVLAGTAFLTTTGDAASLVSMPKGGHMERVAKVSTPYLAVVRGTELVFTQGDQIVLLSARGLHALIELPESAEGVVVERDAPHGTEKIQVPHPLATFGRVKQTRAMAATDQGVFYACTGNFESDVIQFVPRGGGLPRALFTIPRREDAVRGDIAVRFVALAASAGRLAVLAVQSTSLGGTFACELLVLDGKKGSVIERTPVAASGQVSLAMSGDRILVGRRVDRDEVIEAWTIGGTAWKHVTRRQGRGLALQRDIAWIGDGDALVRVDLAQLSAGPSAKVAQLVELIRKASGQYEKTTFQGKPAIKISAADGSRSIKPVSEVELALIEEMLSAT